MSLLVLRGSFKSPPGERVCAPRFAGIRRPRPAIFWAVSRTNLRYRSSIRAHKATVNPSMRIPGFASLDLNTLCRNQINLTITRSRWITGAIVVQALWALALMGLVVLLLVMTRTAGPDASAGLKTAAAILLVPALVAISSWYGLWKQALWGWWLPLLTDLALLAMFVYSMADDGLRNIDWEMAGMTVTSAIAPIFLLIPVVRRFYWHVPSTR